MAFKRSAGSKDLALHGITAMVQARYTKKYLDINADMNYKNKFQNIGKLIFQISIFWQIYNVFFFLAAEGKIRINEATTKFLLLI